MNGNMFSIANQIDLEAARVGFHVALVEALEAVGPDPLEDLYTEVQSTTSVEEWDWLGDLPGFEEWKGDRKMGDLEAFKMRIANKDWASGLRVHQNQFKDDKLGLFGPSVGRLAQKARRHRSDLAVRQFLNGFDGTAYPDVGDGLAYDGELFFSEDHASGSNLLEVALTGPNLDLADEMLMNQTTQDGQDPLDVMGTDLIVGPSLKTTAEELVNSIVIANGSAGVSNTRNGRYRIRVSRRLRGPWKNYWFLADLSAPIKPAILQMREEISTSAILGGQGSQQDSIPRFKAGELWFGAEARYNVGLFAFQTIVGSKVAA